MLYGGVDKLHIWSMAGIGGGRVGAIQHEEFKSQQIKSLALKAKLALGRSDFGTKHSGFLHGQYQTKSAPTSRSTSSTDSRKKTQAN
jgi:hypothetical protein